MTFETVFENYQVFINHEKKIKETIEKEGITTNSDDYIKIKILDIETMYKYETRINSYEDIENLPDFMQNLETIRNMICSALEKKSKSIKCSLIKQTDKIILDVVYKAEFFEIPFKIPVILEPENENIVFERKMRILQVQNKKLEQSIIDFKNHLQKDVDILKKQLGNVIFLPTCDKPIPIWIEEMTLNTVSSEEDWINFFLDLVDMNKNPEYMSKFLTNNYIDQDFFHGCNCTSLCKCPSMNSKRYSKNILQLFQSFEEHLNRKYGQENVFIFKSGEIEALSLLKNLKRLKIRGNGKISDIEVLSNLENLEELSLINCPLITDLNAISKLRNLKKLDITGCTAIKDLTPISLMTNLETLIMENTKVENKLCLSQLINLKIIS